MLRIVGQARRYQSQQLRRQGASKTEQNEGSNKLQQEWRRLKQVAHEHGRFFSVYNSGIWWVTGVVSIGTMELLHASNAVYAVTGLSPETIGPMFLNLVMGLVVNEMIEPLRFPVAAITVPPLHAKFLALQAKREAKKQQQAADAAKKDNK